MRTFLKLYAPEGDGASAAGGTGAATMGGAANAGAGAAAAAGAAASGAGAAAAAAAPPPKPFFEGFYDKDGKIDKTSLDRLPDHLKPHKELFAKYENVDAMLHGFANAHSMAVKKALAPLDANAPEPVRAERKQLLDTVNNVPKDPKGYGIARPEDLPEQFWNEEGAGKFAALAQKHSISPDAVKELLGLQLEMTRGEISKGQQMETEYYTAEQTRYEAEVRKQGIGLDPANELAKRGASTLGIKEDSPLLKNAEFRLAMIRGAQLISEDRQVQGGDPAAANAQSPRDQARDIMGNPQNPLNKAWNDTNDPRHEMAKARVSALYASHKEKR